MLGSFYFLYTILAKFCSSHFHGTWKLPFLRKNACTLCDGHPLDMPGSTCIDNPKCIMILPSVLQNKTVPCPLAQLHPKLSSWNQQGVGHNSPSGSHCLEKPQPEHKMWCPLPSQHRSREPYLLLTVLSRVCLLSCHSPVLLLLPHSRWNGSGFFCLSIHQQWVSG